MTERSGGGSSNKLTYLLTVLAAQEGEGRQWEEGEEGEMVGYGGRGKDGGKKGRWGR